MRSLDPETLSGIPLEGELRDRIGWLVSLRWVAALGIALGALAFHVPGRVIYPFYVIAVAVAFYNCAFVYIGRYLKSEHIVQGNYSRLVWAQVGLDWVALTALVFFSGGLQSPVVLAFDFHVIIGAILLSRRSSWIQSGIATGLLGAVAVAEANGLLDRWQLGIFSHLSYWDDMPLLYRWGILSSFLLITTFLTTSVISPLRRKEENLVRSERELELANRELEALRQVGQALNSTLDPHQVLDLIAANGAQRLRKKACSIRLLDRAARHLQIGATYGLSPAYLDKGQVEVEKSGLDAEVLAGAVVQILDVDTDPRFQYPAAAQQEGIRSVLCVPLSVDNEAIGVVRVYAALPHRFSTLEVRFLQSLADLGAVAIRNAHAYADLEALEQQRIWFARVTHHQLRAPLAAIQSMLDGLKYAGPLATKQAELVDRGRHRVQEGLRMIQDLLDLAAAQRVTVSGEGEKVELLAALHDAVETARGQAEFKGVELVLEVATELAVFCQAEDVRRIFGNLLDNAVKYTSAGGRVRFAAVQTGKRLEVVVEDTGIGIDAADQERVFAGFFRSRAARDTGEVGTGMGLSIVKQLVERWNGELQLESAAGQGSRFVVSLPAA